MSTAMKPKVRAIEPITLPDDGRGRVGLRDPSRKVEHVLSVPQHVIPIISLMDGTRTLPKIQEEFKTQFGCELPLTLLDSVVESLEEALFLESEAFADHEMELNESYRTARMREAAFAGTNGAYPADPAELRPFLRRFFTHELGPGESDSQLRQGRICGAIIPHIDFQRGGHSYAHVYRRLAESEPADTYVILGTNHFGSGGAFTLTRSDFITPLGRVDVDQQLVERLVAAGGEQVLADEFDHKHEHSVEFQAVFLRYLHDSLYGANGSGPSFTIVPILCGGFHELMRTGRRPWDDPQVRAFLDELRRIATGDQPRVCVVASADLAHVGARFGQDGQLTPRLLRKLECCDRDMLRHVQRLDANGFYDFIAREDDRRSVCGFASIFTLLATSPARQAQLLRYDQAIEKEGETPHSVVTFAGMVLR